MCARRFLVFVTLLTLLAVAAAFAIFNWGSDVLLKQATPKGHFEAPLPSSGPDYATPESWIARPGIDERVNPASWRPAQFPPPILTPKRFSAFYVHPTTYLERDRWNAPLDDPDRKERTELFVRTQASAFGNVADVWAPRYRQASFGAFLLNSSDARRALDLAYSDVSAAFDEFLRQSGEKPIILAAHSQGALHLLRLLADRKGVLEGRLVAAYVVGWPISTAADLPALGFPACERAGQTGCILSWMSFSEPANPRLILAEWTRTDGLAGSERRQDDILCVNPLTGTRNGGAPRAANPGTLVPTVDLKDATLVPGRVGGRCDKGLLLVDGDIPAMGPFVLPGNNYHVYDYALFWGAIARDAQRRTGIWLQR